MKLQSLGIIFVIIIMPMILIISYYLGLQIDTITLRNKYENALIDATNDAMNAFELNTANEDLSNVSDSLRTIVEASNNTFFNTFATSIGVSNANKNTIEPYIPAILYTLYDGYYIYAPTRTPIIMEKVSPTGGGDDLLLSEGFATVGDEGVQSVGGNEYRYNPGSIAITGISDDYGQLLYKKTNDNYTTNIDDPDLVYKTDYALKSFMPYSATYESGTDSATVNYTLDNYINVSAKIRVDTKDVYYTKSGYYINTALLTNVNGAGMSLADLGPTGLGQEEIREICEGTENINVSLSGGIQIISNMDYQDKSGITENRTLEYLENELRLIKQNDEPLHTDPDFAVKYADYIQRVNSLEVQIANRKAVEYYLTNTAFSNWVNASLGFVTSENLVLINDAIFTLNDSTSMYYDFHNESNADQSIFSDGSDPEDSESLFNNHRYNIIKNSIKYNLNVAISTYDNMMNELSFAVPDLSQEEWELITEKLSIVAFAQGLDCGLKNFSDYAVISSTNNEMTVIPEEIYYVRQNSFNDENEYYHRLDCAELSGIGPTDVLISFKSKEVKYDDVKQQENSNVDYLYDHKNLACYECIVNNNYTNVSILGVNRKAKLRAYLDLEDDEDVATGVNYRNTTPNINLTKAYFIAVAKERQNLYKTTQYSQNEGIETSDSGSITWNNNISKALVTIEIVNPLGVVGEVTVGGALTGKVLSTGTKSVQTIEIPNSGTGGAVGIDGLTNHTNYEVRGIKYIYK